MAALPKRFTLSLRSIQVVTIAESDVGIVGEIPTQVRFCRICGLRRRDASVRRVKT